APNGAGKKAARVSQLPSDDHLVAPLNTAAVELERFGRFLLEQFNKPVNTHSVLRESGGQEDIQEYVHHRRRAVRRVSQLVDRTQRVMQSGGGFERDILFGANFDEAGEIERRRE